MESYVPLKPYLKDAPLPSEHLSFTVIAIDPGVTTGWALFTVKKTSITDPNKKLLDNILAWRSGDLVGEENGQASSLLHLLRLRPRAQVVIEDFTLRKFTKDRELLSPVRIAAKIDYGMFIDQRKVHWQQPSLAKSTLTDERLKRIGLWGKLSPHQRDAIRHGLTYLRRVKG